VEPRQAARPARTPIEVLCDERTAPRLARVAVRRNLIRGTGLFLLIMGAALAVIGSFIFTPAVGIPVALVVLTVQVLLMQRSAVRSFRRMAPPGQVLATRYADGALYVATAIGSSALAAGSVDRVERLGDCTHIRMLPGRRWALVPAELLTDDDLEFLLGNQAVAPAAGNAGNAGDAGSTTPADLTAPGSSAQAGVALPLLHVVTPASRRALQAAVAGHACHSREGRVLTAGMVLALAAAALVRDPVTFSLLAVWWALFTVAVAGPALAARRQRPVGHLIRAAVTPSHLVVQEQDNRSTLPWSSIRSCSPSRGAVIVTLTSGVVLPLPRALFPDTELARLQQKVRHLATT
jgi:hypothetical protein